MDKKKRAADDKQAEKSTKTGAEEAFLEENASAESQKGQKKGAREETSRKEEAASADRGQDGQTQEGPDEELDRELARARAEAEDYKRKWYSVTAEYENYRKRTARDSATRYAEGRADVVKGLFPIADNLDRALAACKDEATQKGIAMVKDAFEKLLEAEHIEVIDPVGEPFDAQKHEAIMAVDPAEGEESGTVKQVYLKGYERDGKVLRFAQVVVTR